MKEEKAKKLHYELWDWLSHHPSKRKRDWPGFKDIAVDMNQHMNCFACLIAFQRSKEFEDRPACETCPLTDIACYSPNVESYYEKWRYTNDKTRSEYARLIRDSWKEN